MKLNSMRYFAVLILGGAVVYAAAQQPLPSAPSAGKVSSPPAQSQTTQAPAPTKSTPQPAQPSQQQQQPFNPGDVVPPDTTAPPPTQKSPEAPAKTAESQPGDPNLDDPAAKFISRPTEVNVVFTVTDKHGRFIRELNKENFSVYDTKQPVKDVRSFSSQSNLPLRVGLLIDTSNSIRDRFKFEQEAAIEFLNQIIRPKEDRAFTIGFDTNPEVTQDWTNSTERLTSGVRMMRPGGGTAFYDAVYFASRDKLLKEKTSGPVRKAMIILSDGDDNQSRVTLSEAIEMAQRAEVIVYTISTNMAPNSDRGDRVLKELAEQTGGRIFHPFKIEDVADAFRDIQEELRSQYVLAYRPPTLAADGTFHPIEIQTLNKKYKVRARRGYYAPKQ
jgi:VWFA-related protein